MDFDGAFEERVRPEMSVGPDGPYRPVAITWAFLATRSEQLSTRLSES
jgi:hypothetical protein